MKYSKESISFWKTDYGSLKTHNKGLTEQQIEFLKTLKVGDELILFTNQDKKDKTSPDHSLKKINRTKDQE
jgi:hypothetical protein